jgi:hypothetical protein
MPPKPPRALDWRFPTIEDLPQSKRDLDGQKLWAAVRKTLPDFGKLPADDQQYTIDRIATVLLWTSLENQRAGTRPTLPTMRRNIGDVAAAISALRIAGTNLDVASLYRLTVAAGDYTQSPSGDAFERGVERWADFNKALKAAASWVDSALRDIPPKEKKVPPPGLDVLVADLANIFENTFASEDDGVRPREISRSTNAHSFLEFVEAIAGLAPGFRKLSRFQIDHAIRRVAPPPRRRGHTKPAQDRQSGK